MTKVYEDAMHRAEVHNDVIDTELARLTESLATDWPTPENYLPKIKQQITDFLVALGHPEPGVKVIHRERDWRIFAAGMWPEAGEVVNSGWSYTRRYSEPLTPEREAADIYFIIIEVETALSRGDMANVFAHALRLGAAVNRFNARRLHLRSVTRGVKVADGLRSAAHQTNALHGDQRQARFARMSELVAVMGVDSAAAQCETEGLGGREAIKRQWNRHKEKRDT